MIGKLQKKTFLWLGLTGFGALLVFTVEVSLYYPEVKNYFDNSSRLAAQTLVARARQYLTESLVLVSESPLEPSKRELAKERLDLAYGLMNIDYHLREYSCSSSALEKIDQLYMQLEQQSAFTLHSYTNTAASVILCTDDIQSTLDKKRADLANDMLNELNFQVQVLVSVACLVFIAGLVIWGIHHKQSKMIRQNRDEADRWIQHAMEDSLTGARNRRAFDAEITRLGEGNQLFSLLMCDIDYFKQYNDSFGHLEGDKALKLVSDAIRTVLREEDCLYRYGGEELAVILSRTDIRQAEKIGERILNLIRKLELHHPESEHEVVTISIGCATSREEPGAQSLIRLADQRLYQAKKAGRNCIIA
ncbi:GGDEF domain-containing protein [Vibrio sp. JC009]|uniref:GGDEF domain-containing protein n=1 Tax=Vibrio sp. JC009 TaxID=2912314 RepID=UPI0023B13DA8|nr:GGDEF domain-containing protein [Vibrio sp. JC009]WED22171.1 GGDEF domain-containing protein [Vibrio sp. JC009]